MCDIRILLSEPQFPKRVTAVWARWSQKALLTWLIYMYVKYFPEGWNYALGGSRNRQWGPYHFSSQPPWPWLPPRAGKRVRCPPACLRRMGFLVLRLFSSRQKAQQQIPATPALCSQLRDHPFQPQPRQGRQRGRERAPRANSGDSGHLSGA